MGLKDTNLKEEKMKAEIGKRMWHRIFGWITITHPYNKDGTTLVDSDHKHIKHFINGKGWVDYIGTGQNGNIVSIFLNKNELFDEPQNDLEQSILNKTIEVIK